MTWPKEVKINTTVPDTKRQVTFSLKAVALTPKTPSFKTRDVEFLPWRS